VSFSLPLRETEAELIFRREVRDLPRAKSVYASPTALAQFR